MKANLMSLVGGLQRWPRLLALLIEKDMMENRMSISEYSAELDVAPAVISRIRTFRGGVTLKDCSAIAERLGIPTHCIQWMANNIGGKGFSPPLELSRLQEQMNEVCRICNMIGGLETDLHTALDGFMEANQNLRSLDQVLTKENAARVIVEFK